MGYSGVSVGGCSGNIRSRWKTIFARNHDGKYRGMITMRTAVRWSVNVYAVKLADEIGIKNGVNFAEVGNYHSG